MKRKLLAIVLAVMMMVAAVVPAAAYTQQQQKTADALNELGLFQGMGGTAGYALDLNLTRAQGITLLVRMIGKEAEAEAGTFRTPFVDVPNWAAGYVGYAYNHNITNGMGADKFGSDVQLNDYMFLTLVLRALGYSDSGEHPAFVWNDPYGLAYAVGLIREAKADPSFTRGDAVEVFWAAMYAEMVGKNMTLAENLMEQGIFTAEEFEAAEEIWKNGRVEKEEETTENDTEVGEEEKPEDTTPPEEEKPEDGEEPENPGDGEDQQPEDPGEGEDDGGGDLDDDQLPMG